VKRTLIAGCDVITLDAKGRVLPASQVAVEGRKVVGVGEVPAGFVPDERIDATGKLLLPALYNAHCHSPMTFERGWAEDLPLDRWFNEKIWVAESALTADDVYWGAALAACEMIRAGCVGFNDHYFHMDRVGEVVRDSGMKASLTWCVFGIGADKEVGADLTGTLGFIERWQGAADGRIRTILGPHSPYVCPPEFLMEVGRIARERALPVHIHVAESDEQVRLSVARHRRTPVAHLEHCGLLAGKATLAHGLYLTEEDLTILAAHDVTVVRCPITYMKLAMGSTPARTLLDRCVNVAIGTDGPGSNNDMDMLLATRIFALLEKHVTQDATAMAGDLALRCATRSGARAMGFADAGAIEAGAAADLILIDCARPHMRPRHDLVANVVHGARSGDVADVMCDGRWLMRDRVILTLDEKTILEEADARARAMVGKSMQVVRSYQG
jgi:5-methylthioadenosine/S-adenosylhomocysteine deaminase